MAHRHPPRAVIFDLYNTLIEIKTDEGDEELWRGLARLLRYRGLPADAALLRPAFEAAARATRRPGEAHPEVDLVAAFDAVLAGLGSNGPAPRGAEVAGLFRALTMRRFAPYPDAVPALERLRPAVAVGLVSDAQRVFLEPELRLAGLGHYFPVKIVSGDYGFRKPDPRMFAMALAALGVAPDEAAYVGDHPYHDVCGARAAGLTAILLARPGRRAKDARACAPDLTVTSLDEVAAWALGAA
jgi:putative hydrolase of the HAD superfamily